MKPRVGLPDLVAVIRDLQRQRVTLQRSRIMIDNRLVANVATIQGYHAGMEETERKERFDRARKEIERVKVEEKNESDKSVDIGPLVPSVSLARDGFYKMEKNIELLMEKHAKQLPIYPWLRLTDQRGFGLLSLAIVIGEAGDLSNYANPGKLWRRMGCAPYEGTAGMLMGSTHRMRKDLSSEEWEDYGYSPRRRSVVYVISEALLKGNGAREANPQTGKPAIPAGPYAARYVQKKAEAIARDDSEWTPPCKSCHGRGGRRLGVAAKSATAVESW